jgi:SAM-dependent methyltransferase
MFHVKQLEEIQPPEKCVICGNKNLQPGKEVKDYFCSGEVFRLFTCSVCELLTTTPQPSMQQIIQYYEAKDYLSHDTSSKSLKSFLYRVARRYAVRNKFLLISKYRKHGSILDYGCGTGEFLNFFKNKNWETLGVEKNPNARNEAILNYKLDIYSPDQFDLPKETRFDVITFWHVLEHLYDPLELLMQLTNHLSDDGILLLALPNYKSWDAQKFDGNWAAYDVPRHLFHFSPVTVTELARQLKLDILEIHPMKLDAYYISLLSRSYQFGKTNYLLAIYDGFRSNEMAKSRNLGFSSNIFILKRR